jgi:hypothetical protein
LPCPRGDFPCVYLGLPISNKRLKKSDLMPWIEKIGNKLPEWKAALMNMEGKTTWARFVISVILVCRYLGITVPSVPSLRSFVLVHPGKGAGSGAGPAL